MMIPDSCLGKAKLYRPHGDYAVEVEKDFAQIEPCLPEKVGSILDIGCGLAGIDVLLKQKYPMAHLSLLDSNGSSPVYGWGEKNNPYGAREEAEMLLEANGFQVDRWINAGTTEPLTADLVISLVAWGFHFPISTYKVSGYCIADLRKHHEPVRGRVIYENDKVARCAFTC